MFRLPSLAGLTAGLALAQTLSVDAGAARHPISPDIYGVNIYFADETAGNYWNLRPDFAQAGATADLRLAVRRWGGDHSSRYNWMLDVWNSANDWYFEISPDVQNPQPELLPDGSRFDVMLEYTRASGGKLIGTVPLLGWLPSVRPVGPPSPCSYSVAKYGLQQQTDPGLSDCGNGIRPDGRPVENDPNDVARLYDENFQIDWVKHLVAKYGKAGQGGVAIWGLDNEPVWWSGVHRDIHPQPQTYQETVDRGIRYASAIKDTDPTALVSGPTSANWGSFFFSYADFQAAWNIGPNWWANPVDRNAHGGVDFSSWYLRQFRDYEQRAGRRLLDYFDLHFYNILAEPANDAQRLRSTRMLWDPDFVATDSYWGFDEQGRPAHPRLIPRMRDWVNQNYPGTKTALMEYDFGAHDSVVGALVQADALGIFGREGLDMAALWPINFPRTTDPFAFAFRMYRNYDGMGGAFGETSVQATAGDPDRLSVFAAQRSDGALTILVLNKTTGDLSSSVGIANFTPAGPAQVWQYSQADLNAILRQPDAAVTGSTIDATFPAYSLTLFVVPASGQGPKPVVTAVVNAASYQNRIAPGQLVIVSGDHLGPTELDGNFVVGSNSVVGTAMDGVTILFDGVPAPLVYVSQHQCMAAVPYLAALKPTVHVQVEYQGVRSDPLPVDVSPTAPGLFTLNAQGSGQAAALNAAGSTLNSPAAPAAPGSAVVLWATGEGVTSPLGVDGRLAIDILPKPVASCAVEIGGLPATVEYCGAAPNNMPGLFQVNARLDAAVAPGDAVPVRVFVGGTPSQSGVTLAVRRPSGN